MDALKAVGDALFKRIDGGRVQTWSTSRRGGPDYPVKIAFLAYTAQIDSAILRPTKVVLGIA